jgi:hypothetical protein
MDEKRDRGSGRPALVNPRKDFHPVFFLPGRRPLASSGPSSVELFLDVIGGQFQAGRASVHDRSNGRAVRLAPGGYSKENP